MIRFCVSRQLRWPDGLRIVEITEGGGDYMNPDALAGHCHEHETCSEAVEAAIDDADKWARERPKDKIYLAIGYTHGMTAALDEMPRGAATYAMLRKIAKRHDATIPRCAECGEYLSDEKYGDPSAGEFDCCSERCAEKRYFVPIEEEA